MTPRQTLIARLRLADPNELEHLGAVLRWTQGSVQAACKALDLPTSTLYGIARAVPAVAAVLEAHGVHREGLARRRWQDKSRGSTTPAATHHLASDGYLRRVN